MESHFECDFPPFDRDGDSLLEGASGLTQVQLCDFAVVDRSFYQRVEACTENVTIEYLEKLRPVLKCTWADIFKGLD